MPIPWCTHRGHFPISKLEHRAITVQQLRAIRLLLQRLCKSCLLMRQGRPANWFEIDMYDIRDSVIKRVIPFLEAERGSNNRYSWVELVADREQPPHMLFSHWWCGRFRDFMAVVENVLAEKGLSITVAIWVCTFANSQFGEDFGSRLEESPFHKAITVAEWGTVLVVDREAGSLQRSWCSVELLSTHKMNKHLELHTASGRIGSSHVSSGPLVDAVESWDVTKCGASEDADRRLILNALAGVDQTQGLKTKEDGSLELTVDKRKSLEDVSLVHPASKIVRHTPEGEVPEYAYEANLLRDYQEEFDKFSKIVQGSVKEAMTLTRQLTMQSSCRDLQLALDQRGVTLGQLRIFVRRVKDWCARGLFAWNSVTTSEVVQNFVAPAVAPKDGMGDCAYMQLLAPGAQKPQIFIDHSWNMSFRDSMASLDWLTEARQLPDSTVLWFDVLSVRQARDEDLSGTTNGAFSLEQHPVFKILDECDGIFCLWADDLSQIARSWRMLELHICFQRAKAIDFGCTKGALACTSSFPEGGWEFGHFDPTIARLLATIDSKAASASNQLEDDAIKSYIGSAAGGFARLDRRLRRKAAGPVLRNAAFLGDVDEIQRICSTLGLVVNSRTLKGGLGETAVHVAAAAGRITALQALLGMHADVDAEDHIQETPLHYAALAGQWEAAKLLLTFGANSEAESSYGETPLQVAEQNPAKFLGTTTQSVLRLLSAWSRP
eukprot:TRINITY_DN73572_c0_g1_i1.p1 TRINITY_DN73572_c0_g1~~TRINITY_DN73572_c0_g1_i1.p1  ORF type:complete len:720 (-),score=111.46 TRINITY_DN73572_c0_g1_i1:194-2353(-)